MYVCTPLHETHWEKARGELYKTAALWSFALHVTNNPSKVSKTCAAGDVMQAHKRRSLVDS